MLTKINAYMIIGIVLVTMGVLLPGPQFSLMTTVTTDNIEARTLVMLAPIGNGQTSPTIGTYIVTNSSVEVTAVADRDYYFSHWIVDDLNAGSTNPLSLDLSIKGHQVYAVFQSASGGPYVVESLDWTQPIVIYGIPLNIFFTTIGFAFIVLGIFRNKQRNKEQL